MGAEALRSLSPPILQVEQQNQRISVESRKSEKALPSLV